MMWSKLKQDIWEWRGVFSCADNHWYCDRPTVDRDYQVIELSRSALELPYPVTERLKRNRIPADLMRDALVGAFPGLIVLIGSTASTLNDYFYNLYNGDQMTTVNFSKAALTIGK